MFSHGKILFYHKWKICYLSVKYPKIIEKFRILILNTPDLEFPNPAHAHTEPASWPSLLPASGPLGSLRRFPDSRKNASPPYT